MLGSAIVRSQTIYVLDKLVGSFLLISASYFPLLSNPEIVNENYCSMASVREISFAISCFVLLLGGALFAGLSIGIRSEYQFQSGTKIRY